jgi:hypothetical protein
MTAFTTPLHDQLTQLAAELAADNEKQLMLLARACRRVTDSSPADLREAPLTEGNRNVRKGFRRQIRRGGDQS